jgi:6-phosphogluconolactonase
MIKYFALFIILFSVTMNAQQNNHNLLIGTYTNTCGSNGIYVYDFNSETGDFQLRNATNKVINPSFLTLSPDKKYVYSVNEDGDNSQVSAFKYESDTLEFLNAQNSEGNDPCHITSDDTNVLVANYSGGSIVVYGRKNDGSLGIFKQIIKHNGKSINKARQEKSHMHMVQFSPDKKYVFAADLGTDYVYIYRYRPNEKSAILTLHNLVKVKPGSGPRHLTFSPDGKFVYLIEELDGTVLAFKYNDGDLELIQETTVVNRKFKGEASAAEILISADGKFLYATNRGDANTISCFGIKGNGKLKIVETISTLGKGPRSFAIDPTGNFLLIAHQNSNDVVVFKVDKTTGKLTDTSKRLALCAPVCVVFE